MTFKRQADGAQATRLANEYDAIAAIYDELPVAAAQGPSLFADSAQDLKARMRVLDIGCGTGRALQRLTGLFEKSIGFDLSFGMLIKARDSIGSNQSVQLIRGHADLLPFKTNTFDYIISHTTLHHLTLPHQVELLRACSSLLRPGGRLVVADIMKARMMRISPPVSRIVSMFISTLLLRSRPPAMGAGHRAWLRHLQRDRRAFLSPKEFLDVASRALSASTVHFIRREYGLVILAVLQWDKPA